MFDFIQSLFSRDNASKNTAKERLRLVLVHDRASLSPQLMDMLKEDLISVISRYMEIDESALEVALEREEDTVALVANIPVRKLKRACQAR